MTAALEGGEWSAARPGRTLPPGKTRYPFYRRLGGPHGRSGRAENLVPTGIRSRIFQPVVCRYTDWATRPTIICNTYCFSTATVVTRMRLIFALYVHCLSCYVYRVKVFNSHHDFNAIRVTTNSYLVFVCRPHGWNIKRPCTRKK